jgi:hypothetical protein
VEAPFGLFFGISERSPALLDIAHDRVAELLKAGHVTVLPLAAAWIPGVKSASDTVRDAIAQPTPCR